MKSEVSVSALWLWVRSVTRQQLLSTVLLAVLAGAVGGLVAVALDANERAASSLDRFLDYNRSYDLVVFSCPPDVAPNDLTFEELMGSCLSPSAAAATLALLVPMPEVEQAAVGTSAAVLGTLDPEAPNGWGYASLMSITATPDVPWVDGRPIVVRGRLADVAAPDEVVIDEAYANITGAEVGDVLRLASWGSADLDAGANGLVEPTTPESRVRVVGVVRYPPSLQLVRAVDLSRGGTDGSLSVGAEWATQHGAEFGNYGWGVAVRLRAGAGSVEEFQVVLSAAFSDRFVDTFPIQDRDLTPTRTTIDMERRGVSVLAAIVAVAGAAFVGIALARQMRRDSAAAAVLASMGVTRSELALAGALRGAPIALLSGVTTVLVALALSPLSPVGKAREAEVHLGVHLAPLLTALVALTVMTAIVLLCALAQRGSARPRTLRPARSGSLGGRLRQRGPSTRAASAIARGRPSIATGGVVVVAVALGVGAGGVMRSLDHTLDEPALYGAWWHLVVGNYSQQGMVDATAQQLRANPLVRSAAGALSDTESFTVNGTAQPLLAFDVYKGTSSPTIVDGRAPADLDEMALGSSTMRELGLQIGDVAVFAASELGFGDLEPRQLTVVGEVVLMDPAQWEKPVDRGVLVDARLIAGEAAGVAQSIVVEIDPAADRRQAVDEIVAEFPAAVFGTTPPNNLDNLDRIRWLPGLIAAIVGLLALAASTQALVTMLQRNRRLLAMLSALGMTRSQVVRVGALAGWMPVAAATAVGVPIGLIVGDTGWRTLADGAGIVAEPVTPWLAVLLIVVGAFAGALLIGALTTRRLTDRSPATSLHAE